MLEGLAKVHPAFAHWRKKAKSRAAANEPAWTMPPNIDELAEVFERGRQYKDIPREPWPELGYSVSAWNGLDRPYAASLVVRAGTYADWIPFPNTVDLRLPPASPDNADLTSIAALKPAMLSVVAAWEPDYGSLVCWGYWRRLFGDRHYPLFRSGWMTYLAPRYASRITPPPAAITEPVVGGGLLLLATEEPFSVDNPTHLAVADAIQAALEPLQEMVAPGRDTQLPQSRRS
jgi:immunity protein 52 of polymorphic toxin system